MSKHWQGQVAVVIGGASGIGLALSRRLAAEGMDVVIASTNRAKLDAAAAELRALTQRRIEAWVCDVADRTQVRELARRATAEFGQVDLVCANAGATTFGPCEHFTDADWDWALGVNLLGVTHCVQAFYPDMVRRGAGTLLLAGSQTALLPDWVATHGPYVPAKAAVVALGLALRAEAQAHGVRVSVLIPGATDTKIDQSARRVGPQAALTAPRLDPDYPAPEPPASLSADEVAARAITGLKANAPLIVTHAGRKPLVQQFFNRILAAYDEAARWQPDPP